MLLVIFAFAVIATSEPGARITRSRENRVKYYKPELLNHCTKVKKSLATIRKAFACPAARPISERA